MQDFTPEMIAVLAILAGAITVFVTEVVRIDVAAVCVMVIVGLSGLVPPEEVFSGFASTAVIAIIAVMILGAGLDRVGLTRRLAALLLRIGGKTERRIAALLSSTVAGISAFMQNIGSAALFLPVAERLSERKEIPSSRLLMPMGFAAILGGTLTLVASGPLILLNDLLASSAESLGVEIEPYGLFSPTPIGLSLALAGILLFAALGPRLLPQVPAARRPEAALPDIATTYGLDRQLYPYRLPRGSALVGARVEAAEAKGVGVSIVAIQDRDGLLVAPPRDHVLEAGAAVALGGSAPEAERFAEERGLEPAEGDLFTLLQDEEHAGLSELLVRPGGESVGRKVRDLRLRQRYGITVLAVHRSGGILAEDPRGVTLAAGDVLVVFSPWERLRQIAGDPSFVILADYPSDPPRTAKQGWAGLALAVALGLVLFTDLPLPLALMTGAGLVLVSGVLTPDEAYRAVSWKTVFLLAALIPLGRAMEDTGAAAWIAQGIVTLAGGLPLWAAQLTIAALTTILTLTISNLGATVLLVPLAANVAVGIGADPAQFGLIVALAASNAFLLPTHQVNALLMGPGGYRVADFLRAGLAMTAVFFAVLIPTVNLFA